MRHGQGTYRSVSAADLTQAEAYALYENYGGWLDEKARSQLNHLLTEMAYPEQPVANVRAEVGDRLYFPAARALAELLAREAAGVGNPPPAPRPRYTRGGRAREAAVAGAVAGRAWRELVEQAKKPAKITIEEEIDA